MALSIDQLFATLRELDKARAAAFAVNAHPDFVEWLNSGRGGTYSGPMYREGGDPTLDDLMANEGEVFQIEAEIARRTPVTDREMLLMAEWLATKIQQLDYESGCPIYGISAGLLAGLKARAKG